MEKCLVIPGPFVPYNDTITQLVYKQLRLLDFDYDVCALGNPEDPGLKALLEKDPSYSRFHIHTVDKYNNVLFSIKNVDLIKGLRHMKRYVTKATAMYNNQPVVYTNSWPCYTVRPAVQIKKDHPNVLWIASFSDPINHSPYKFDTETYKAYSLPEKIAFNLYCKYYVVDQDEADAFEHADILVFICQEQRDFMIQQYVTYFHNLPEEEVRKKCVIVPLNYVPEWNQLSIKNEETSGKKNDTGSPSHPYVLAHFGRVYGLRLIAEFIHAVRLFHDAHPGVPFRIDQYGEFRKSDRNLIGSLGLTDLFRIHEKVPYDECIERMKEADGVLLFDTILPDHQIQPYLPSKILEYSLLKKQVLAVSTITSPAYRICKESDAIACTYNRYDIQKGLEELLIQKKPSVVNYAETNAEAVRPLRQQINEILNLKTVSS